MRIAPGRSSSSLPPFVMRGLILIFAASALTLACSGDRPFGPSVDPFDACTGRLVVLRLRLVVDHVSTHPILQVGDTLRVSRMVMEPGRMIGASCEGSSATMSLRWPGTDNDSTYEALWRQGDDYLEIGTIGEGEYIVVAFGVRRPEEAWLMREENWTTASGHVLRGD